MTAAAEFDRLAALADRVRPRDRAEFWRKVDEAACAAMDEARNEAEFSEVHFAWLKLGPRERGPSRLNALPERVAAAIAEAYYAQLQESLPIPTELNTEPSLTLLPRFRGR